MSPDPQILRRSLPLVGHFLIAHLCALIECAEPSFFDRGDVHEHILAAVIGLNESIALCELSPKVGDGGDQKGGISAGGLTPPLLHPKSDMPCPTVKSSN